MSKEREQKNRQPHRKGEEIHKQHAPSRHGEHEGAGHRGAHHGSQHSEPSPSEPSETDYPPPGRSPSEELAPDEDEGG